MSKPKSYTENDSVKESFKASLFKNLFNERKKLFDGYPAIGKGLVFPEPSVKVGMATYTFKTSDVVDKVTCKSGDQEFTARYKKDTKKWDLATKKKINNEITALLKYEERQSGFPCYVFGADVNKSGVLGNIKFNPATGFMKASLMYDCHDFVQGVKLAADVKGKSDSLQKLDTLNFNVGALYNSNAGNTAVAFNNRGMITLNHVIQLDKKLSAGVEFVQPTKQASNNPLSVAASYRIDSEHDVKARLNKDGDLNVCLDKKFGPGFNLLFATCFNVAEPDMSKAPSFGFKVVAK